MNGWYLAGAAVAGFKVLDWRFRTSVTTYGSAGFMNLWQAVRRKVFFPFPRGLIIGDWKRGMYLPVFYRGASNILTIAPPGSGKGTSMLLPNALTYPFLFIFDPGGEISAVAAKAWRQKGYNFYCINPWEKYVGGSACLPTHSFNPFDQLDGAAKSLESDATLLASMMVSRTGRESETHWLDKTEAWLKGLIMKVVRDGDGSLVTLRRHVTGSKDSWTKLIDQMKADKNETIKNLGNELSRMFGDGKTENKELSSILSSMSRATAWIDDPYIRDAVSDSDVRFEDLKGRDVNGKDLKGTVIACVVPVEYMETHAAFIRLMLQCALSAMQRGKLARQKVLFEIDEAVVLGYMKMLKNILATGRKYRIWINLVYQSIGQIKGAYKEEFGAIMECCELQQFMSPRDLETAEYISRKCGTATVKTTDARASWTRRPLMMPEEVAQLSDKKQIVFMGNGRPMLLRARPYWERPSMRGAFYDNPYHGVTKPPPATWPLQVLYGLATRVTGWVLGPSRTFLLAAAIACAWFGEVGIRMDAAPQPDGWTYCTYQGVSASSVWKFAGACPVLKIGGRFLP